MRKPRFFYAVDVLTIAITIVVFLLVAIVVYQTSQSVERERLILKACPQIKMHVALAHLWLEEALNGDEDIDLDGQVYKNIAQAEALTDVLLNGGKMDEGEVEALREEQVRAHLLLLRGLLARFQQVAKQRWQSQAKSGTPQDKEFDSLFDQIITHTGVVENEIHKLSIQGNRSPMLLNVATLVLLVIIIGGLAWNVRRNRQIESERVRTDKLSESEERFRLLVDGVKDYAILMLDPEGHVISWNEGAKQIKGYEAHEIIGQHFSRFYTLESLQEGAPERELAAAVEQGRSEDTGWRVRKDGSLFFANVIITALQNKAGVVRGFSKVTRDVTERKRMEIREQHQSQIFQALSEGNALTTILDIIVRSVEAEDTSSLCSILLMDETGTHLLHGAAPSLPVFYNEAIHGIAVGDGVGSCGTAAFTGEQVIVEDIQTHPYWANYRELAEKANLRSVWSEPIRNAAGEVLGVFGIYHREPRVPSREDIHRIESAADFARLAIERKRAEAAILAGERRFSDLFEFSPDAIVMANSNGIIVQANSQVETMFGWDRNELVGQPAEMLIPPDLRGSRAKIREHYLTSSVRETTEDGFSNLRGMRRDGTEFPVDIIVTPIGTGDDQLVATAVRDITEQRRAAAVLAASERRFSDMFKFSPNAIVITNSDGFIVQANPQVETLFGWDCKELVGQPVEVIMPPELRAGHVSLRERYLQSPVPRPMGGNLPNLRGMRQDGTIFHIDISLTPLELDDGQLVAATIVDTTERKLAQERIEALNSDLERLVEQRTAALLATERRFSDLFNLSPDAIAITNSDGIIVQANRQVETLFGWDRLELVGQPVKMLMPPDLRASRADIRDHYLQSPVSGTTGDNFSNLRGMRRDGTEFPVDMIVTQIGSGDGRLLATAVRDITWRKQAEDALRHAKLRAEATNLELEAFNYSVAHDLRAPLRSIDGYSMVLFEDYADKLDQEGMTCLRQVRESTKHMAQLIEDLLGLSQVSRGELHRERVDLAAITRTVLKRLQSDCPDRTVELIIPAELVVFGDARLLRIVLENLLGNAWKFTGNRAQGRIEFGQQVAEGRTTYFIQDNGAGFDMAYVNKLFGVFQRLHTASEFEGTGIGLVTVQRIIHRHHGTVWAEGDVDRGATFYFTLEGFT